VSAFSVRLSPVSQVEEAAAAARVKANDLGVEPQVFWNACKLMTKAASSTDKADLFAGTATTPRPPGARRDSGRPRVVLG
jgi:hypothetical protein